MVMMTMTILTMMTMTVVVMMSWHQATLGYCDYGGFAKCFDAKQK
jgi:hypothetical protein